MYFIFEIHHAFEVTEDLPKISNAPVLLVGRMIAMVQSVDKILRVIFTSGFDILESVLPMETIEFNFSLAVAAASLCLEFN